MAEDKVEIVSKITIKPLSPTPNELKHYQFSLLDEISPPPSVYVPVVLFYSSSDQDHSIMSQKLKTSLCEVLTLYYPLCGRRIKGSKSNLYVGCNDEGVLYIEAIVPSKLSDFLHKNTNQQLKEIKGFLPLDPYKPKQDDDDENRLVMAVQVTEFGCGGIAIGMCISHKVCDGTTVAQVLHAWSQKAMGGEACDMVASSSPPNMKASLLFPPMGIDVDINDMIGEKNVTTKRFLFNEDSLFRLQKEISSACGIKPTRVEAVTSLIWKSAMEAAETSEKVIHKTSSFMLHFVNIRGRMLPALQENSLGNLYVPAISPMLDVDKEMDMELQDFSKVVRKTIKMVDGDYVSKFEREGQDLVEVLESILHVLYMVAEKGVPCYTFSSWLRLGFYETDFGWGKPIWVCTVGVAIRNVIFLMPASSEDEGIEAWVTLNEIHMTQFESNPLLLLLRFVSCDP